MSYHLKNHRQEFPWGLSTITEADETENNTGIRFSILRLRQGETYSLNSPMELALLHMQGVVSIEMEKKSYINHRDSLFDDPPFAVHVPGKTPIAIEASTDVEVALFETENEKSFPGVVYLSEQTANEHRGKGLVDDASLRFVRTIFDGSNSHPNTELVLGEVVNFPGRWSSYPPHHHPQPEIYHYRFTEAQGYGHAELGDDVYKVKQCDTIKILDEVDHAQCSAPGYGMYYIWVIRHLDGNRYTVPEFTNEHAWTMQKDAGIWKPKEDGVLV